MATGTGPADRRSRAAAARKLHPLTDIAGWAPDHGRPDPVALIAQQGTDRDPTLVPVRNGRMSVSPFAFYRGAALVMAADIARLRPSGIPVQVCGDAHLVNFGLFASPERELLFDINDFDETLSGAWEWDLMRLSASVVVAARSRGLTAHQARHAAIGTVTEYRTRMAAFADMRAIDVYYSRVDARSVMEFADKRARPYLESTVHSASHHDALHELPRITAVSDGKRHIVDRPPIITHRPEMDEAVLGAAMDGYRATLQDDRRVLLDRYHRVDAAVKVVGVGSVGLGAFVVLLEDGSDADPLFLQVKEAQASVYERFTTSSPYRHHGERVVAGQRLLQAASDVLLGWTTGTLGRHLYVRQLNDQKGSPVVEAMTAEDLEAWAQLCGWTLARGHARSGDPAAIAGYLGSDDSADHAFADFADRYADQTERDHSAFVAAIKSGRIAAEMGV